MLSKDAEYTIQALIDLGVLDERGLANLAGLFRGLKAVSGVLKPAPAELPRRERETEEVYRPQPTSFSYDREAPRGNGHGVPQEAQGEEAEPFEEEPPAYQEPEVAPRQRAPRGSFNVPKLELQNLRDTMTVKQIAQLKGVSPATVNNKLREYGLTEPGRRGRPSKKK